MSGNRGGHAMTAPLPGGMLHPETHEQCCSSVEERRPVERRLLLEIVELHTIATCQGRCWTSQSAPHGAWCFVITCVRTPLHYRHSLGYCPMYRKFQPFVSVRHNKRS
ncbi:hypothetical protein AVEN_73441-1 [Araneus ventricosus]|uniref:Uncharacterized protein n=1 Tax=Araneus ventricosus TaxID=182803 RepID=A0A4Y2GHU1_ARAVE|nr:hypothetical protein AVEN_73441-1 [Araneus ventricosus]